MIWTAVSLYTCTSYSVHKKSPLVSSCGLYNVHEKSLTEEECELSSLLQARERIGKSFLY